MKKILSIAAVCLAITATAAASEPWDGVTATQPQQDATGAYLVGTGAELAWVAQTVNAGTRDINVKLTDDIDLNNKPWTPIGNVKNSWYQGDFDGQNHTISGLLINKGQASSTADNECLGFFGGTALKTQVIKDFTIHGTIEVPSTNTVGTQAGMVIGKSDAIGSMSNVHSDGSIIVNGTIGYVGGLAGFKKGGSFDGCSYSGTITINGTINKGVGGICGTSNSTTDNLIGSFNNCWYTGEMTGDGNVSLYCGGIEGYCNLVHKSTEGSTLEYIQNCYSAGTLHSITNESKSGIGVFYGYVSNSGSYLKRINNFYMDLTEEGYTYPVSTATGKVTTNVKGGSVATVDQFHSGEVCYKLNSGLTNKFYGQDLSETTSMPGVYSDETRVFKVTLKTRLSDDTDEDYEIPEAYTNPTLRLPTLPAGYLWADANGKVFKPSFVVTDDMTAWATPQALAVDAVEGDMVGEIVAIYTLDGRMVKGVTTNALAPGIYIVKSAKGVAKIVK